MNRSWCAYAHASQASFPQNLPTRQSAPCRYESRVATHGVPPTRPTPVAVQVQGAGEKARRAVQVSGALEAQLLHNRKRCGSLSWSSKCFACGAPLRAAPVCSIPTGVSPAPSLAILPCLSCVAPACICFAIDCSAGGNGSGLRRLCRYFVLHTVSLVAYLPPYLLSFWHSVRLLSA